MDNLEGYLSYEDMMRLRERLFTLAFSVPEVTLHGAIYVTDISYAVIVGSLSAEDAMQKVKDAK